MDSKTTELVKVLDELLAVLDSDGEAHWRAWIHRAKSRLDQSDYSGIEYLLSAYGGMGSFNDLVLGQTNVDGRFAWKPGHIDLNRRLDVLRSRAWTLAHALRDSRELPRS